jgi:hypothetical protein
VKFTTSQVVNLQYGGKFGVIRRKFAVNICVIRRISLSHHVEVGKNLSLFAGYGAS